MKRILCFLLIACIFCSLNACNQNPSSENNTTPTITDDSTKNEEITPTEIKISFDTFDEKYLEYKKMIGHDFNNSFIAFPSSNHLSVDYIEPFSTEKEWFSFVYIYDNLHDHENTTIKFKEDGFVFNMGNGFCVYASGALYPYSYTFVSHRTFDPLISIKTHSSAYYDSETKTVYVILEYDSDSRYDDLGTTAEKENITNNSTCAHGIFCYTYDKEKFDVKEIKLILPELLN